MSEINQSEENKNEVTGNSEPPNKNNINNALLNEIFIIFIPFLPISLECAYIGYPTSEILLVTAILSPITIAISNKGFLFIASIIATIIFSARFGGMLICAANNLPDSMSLKTKWVTSAAIIFISFFHIQPHIKKYIKSLNKTL